MTAQTLTAKTHRTVHELEDRFPFASTMTARPSPTIRCSMPAETALLVIDVQNTYLQRPDRASLTRTSSAATIVDAVPRAHAQHGHPEHGANAGSWRGAAASNACLPASPATPRTAATARCRRRCRAGTTCSAEERHAVAARAGAAAGRRRDRRHQDHRLRADRHQFAPDPAQSRHQERHLLRHLHRPVRVLDGAQPGRRELSP